MASDGEISCTNDPNFAVIYSFLKVFGKLYGLEVPSIAKLQQLLEDTEEVAEPLKELHLRLLRRALKSVQSGRWERSLVKFCHQHGHRQEAWEIERFSYKKASTEVKLKTLKILLEYQFTCHAKFKAAVNALSCKDLRLEPVGRDKNGCVYWLQVDEEANLCLYKEDQDEETFQLIARNREELVKVIGQLKSGEVIDPSTVSNANEDSSSNEIPPPTEKIDTQAEDENEEFLSPESESEHDDEESKSDKKPNPLQPESDKHDNEAIDKTVPENDTSKESEKAEHKVDEQNLEPKLESESKQEETAEVKDEILKETDNENINPEDLKSDKAIGEDKIVKDEVHESKALAADKAKEDEKEQITDSEEVPSNVNKTENVEVPTVEEEKSKSPVSQESSKNKDLDEISEAIEEPVMVVTGEGSGADCESYFIGEEISEPVMYFYGEGCGYDNDTGNPEVLEEANNDHHSDEENDNTECVNGEHSDSANDISNTSISKVVNKSVKLKGGLASVTKRSLKKQSNDNSEVLKSDSKKHCVRKPSRSDSLRSNSSSNGNDLKREGSVNEKTTDSESPNKNNAKKTRGKIKRRPEVERKATLSRKEPSPALDADKDDKKASIIEKRKSSVSSDLDGVENTETEKEGSPEKDTRAEDDLPPKKLRLEPTPKDIDASHSKETDTVDNVDKEETKSENNENDDNLNTEQVEKDPIAMRKKIKANKGKFKRKKIFQNKVDNSEIDKSSDKLDDKEKTKSKPLKRSLLDANNSDKNKSESQSESEDDMPVTSGKRLKIRPKKISTASRKKIEAKLLEKKSSDDSEEETLYSIAGKKTGKRVLKKKPKDKGEKNADSEESDPTPVRQSRRIAQQKIKEEADRRYQEEVALRELKMIHKKKSKDDEEEWRASSSSDSPAPARSRKTVGWRAADSSSESSSTEMSDRAEPALEFDKSDHEFSPESDLESGEPSEPLKRARTLQEATDDGFCKRCGSGEQPEWILLCDKCDAGYHASCLKPMLFLVPAGDWFCPPCNHEMLISSLETELVKYDELLQSVEAERKRLKELEPEKPPETEKTEKEDAEDSSSSSSWSSDSSQGAVYRLRARRQLPVSYRAQEYDRLISSAIKEEYVEPTTSAGNQGRGKDISTIIEAAEEEKLKAEREEAIAQGKPLSAVRKKKKQRRKPRKLNSLEVVSEDDDETDEDFKDTGMESSSEEISSSAERDSIESRSSDSLPIRRPCRTDKKDRPKLRESSPEVKKKKGEFAGSSSESSGAKEWPHKTKSKKSKPRPPRDKSRPKKSRKKRGHTQYDAAGNVTRARVAYGLSDESADDCPKHRTRQKKINYTEMPNTESEDEVHKGSGKHMPDSSDEFKVDDSDVTSDSDTERKRHDADEKQKALSDLIKTAVVPLEKLPDDVTKAKEEELQAHLNAATALKKSRRGGRGGRGSRGPRGGRGGRSAPDDALSKLVGVKIKDLGQEPITPNQLEKEKKRQEREAKQAEKEAKRIERIQKKEEKDKLKELKAKEREEKRLAKLALQESRRLKKEKPEFGYSPDMRMSMYGPPQNKHPEYPGPGPEQRYPPAPRLQVRAELRGVPAGGPLAPGQSMREGTLSVAGSPQPFKPAAEEPSVITRMPHMLNHQYRGPMMYGSGNSPYGPRQNMMYVPHPGLPRSPYPQYYRALPGYPIRPPEPNHPLGPRLHAMGSNHGLPRQMNHPMASGLPPNPGLPPTHPSPSSHGPPNTHHPSSHPQSSHGPSPNHQQTHQNAPHGPPGLHVPATVHASHPPRNLPPNHGPSVPIPHPGSIAHPPGSVPHPPGSITHPPGSLPHPPRSIAHPSGSIQHPPGSIQHPPGSIPHPGSIHPPGSIQHAPGSVQHPPGSIQHAPGSIQHAPGSIQHPPGPIQHPPGSIQHAPGSIQHSPGSIQHAPGSIQHPPGSLPIGSHPGHVPSSLHGLLRAGPPVQLGQRPIRPNNPGIPPNITRPNRPTGPIGPSQTPPHSISPATLPPGPSSTPHATPPPKDLIKIKAEVKTEPEYHSPAQSPPSEPEPPRPKVKHTNKERRIRHPLGPYAPQYGPYGPYAPEPSMMNLPRPQFLPEPQYLPQYKPEEPRAEPKAPETEPSVFGGLVSYFSSQREDELDA